MWDIGLKARNEQTRQTIKNSETRTTVWWLPEEKGMGRFMKGRGGQVRVMGGDVTWGGKHTVQYTDDAS